MHTGCHTRRRISLLLAAVLLAVWPAAAQTGYHVQVVEKAPPAGLAPGVAAVLDAQAIEVQGPQGVLCRLWLRKQIPARSNPPSMLGVAYPELEPGTLVGVLELPAGGVDFRNQKIPAGVYTLRYELHPVDGNHQGVAPERDFLLASPVAADTAPATLGFDDVVKLSRRTTGTNHPSVWCLLTPEGAPATLPAVQEQPSDAGPLQVLWFRAPLDRGGQPAALTMALVVVGISPAA